MITEFVCQSKHLNVHVALQKKYRKLLQLKQDDAKLNNIYKKLASKLKCDKVYWSDPSKVDKIMDAVKDYIFKKRQWLKADVTLSEIFTRPNEEVLLTDNERNAFRH